MAAAAAILVLSACSTGSVIQAPDPGPGAPVDAPTIYDESIFPAMLRRLDSGAVDPVVAQTFPLADIARAQEVFGSIGMWARSC